MQEKSKQINDLNDILCNMKRIIINLTLWRLQRWASYSFHHISKSAFRHYKQSTLYINESLKPKTFKYFCEGEWDEKDFPSK